MKQTLFPDINSPLFKLTVEGVVDSEEQLNMLKQTIGETNPESTIRVRSVEKQCIELIVEINSSYLKSKKLMLEAVTHFFNLLTTKQAFKWKSDKVIIVITIAEGNLCLSAFCITFNILLLHLFQKHLLSLLGAHSYFDKISYLLS